MIGNAAHAGHDPARIVSIRIKNYRLLRDVELTDLTPLSVFLGPNGSGKSTLFDVFAFLSECFNQGLRSAWDKRNRFQELRSRGSAGPISFEIRYRESTGSPLITYFLAIDECERGPVVAEESLRWRRGKRDGKPFKFLDFSHGSGLVVSGELPEEDAERGTEQLESPDLLAVSALGQFAQHPRVAALRRFIAGWYLSYLSADSARETPLSGPQERLSRRGDNLPNVIQYLEEQHHDRLELILDVLARRIPQLERVDAQRLADGRLLLHVKDAPFDEPILARFASDGTLKMLSYLTVLYDPSPPPLIGIEEPENHLHPRLLEHLAEECRAAATNSQLLVTSHSPNFVNALQPAELWAMHRGDDGFTKAVRASEMEVVSSFVEHGGKLGDLWMEGYFEVGDPLNTRSARERG